ncbi:hypothetical protein ACFUG9_24670 [Streptomyces griseoincarnatus]
MNGDAATTRQPWSLLALDRAFRACWAADTCSPDDLPDWRPDNPSVGHCDITTLVVNDLFGGDLLVAAVRRAGSPHGYHWWNRLPNGVELDLTLDQFRAGETLSPPRAVTRPPGPPLRRHPEYELLRARLTRQLGPLPSAGGGQAPPGGGGGGRVPARGGGDDRLPEHSTGPHGGHQHGPDAEDDQLHDAGDAPPQGEEAAACQNCAAAQKPHRLCRRP